MEAVQFFEIVTFESKEDTMMILLDRKERITIPSNTIMLAQYKSCAYYRRQFKYKLLT
jgi:hypothetical protein